MTIEAELKALLDDLFNDRIIADLAPAKTKLPYMTFGNVGGVPNYTLCGRGASNTAIQIDVWAASRVEANSLMRTIEQRLSGAPLWGTSLGSFVAQSDEPTKSYGCRQDFSFWFK